MHTSGRGPAIPTTLCAGSWASEPLDVVDLGAGTGKLTRSLVALGHHVTAVEPLPEMIAHLRAAVPGVTAVEGGAEAIPLADGERGCRHGRAGVPLVRPRPGTARDRAGAAARRPHRARLEHPRRARAVGGAAERGGARERGGSRSASGAPVAAERSVRAGRAGPVPERPASSTARGSSTSCSRAATARCSARRSAPRCSRASSGSSTSTRSTACRAAVRDRVLPRRRP